MNRIMRIMSIMDKKKGIGEMKKSSHESVRNGEHKFLFDLIFLF